jgi:hypothetical protein
MGMFDTVNFSSKFRDFPEGLPRNGWQTKDLDCALDEFWVNSAGRVARKSFSQDQYFFSDTACFTAQIYQDVDGRWVELELVVTTGEVLLVKECAGPEEGMTEPDWNIPAPGPNAENDN